MSGRMCGRCRNHSADRKIQSCCKSSQKGIYQCEYKTRKERTTDWDDPGNCERWRTAWADTTNRYLECAGEDVRLDLRSYERQGVDLVPTVHMGPVVTYLEQQGIRTEIGQYNEEIKQFNRVLQSLKMRLASLKKYRVRSEERRVGKECRSRWSP